MTVRGGKRWWWVVGLASGVLIGALVRFLAVQHLDRADQWASVIGMFVGIAALVLAGFGLLQGRRTAPAEPVETVQNTVTDGGVQGPAFLIRDAQRVSLTGTPISADPAGLTGPSAAGPVPGDVENRIEGGTFGGPLIMGRDLRDVVLPPQTPPSSPPAAPSGDETVR